LVGYLFSFGKGIMSKKPVSILTLIIIGVLVRLFIATVSAGNYDMTSYKIVAAIMEHGGNVYASTPRYNYSPIWFWILHGLNQLPLPLNFSIGAFMTIIDVAILACLVRIAETYRITSREIVIYYWLNPAIILIVSYGRQFDLLALLPLLAYLAIRPKNIFWILLAGCLAIAIKHITIFLVWAFFIHMVGLRRTILWMFCCVSVLALLFVPYLTVGYDGIVANVLRYDSRDDYGLTVILPVELVKIIFFVIMLALPTMQKQRDALQSMALTAWAMMAFIYGAGYQYYALVIALSAPLRIHRKAYVGLTAALVLVSLWYL
jgi:hypothetical protein